MKKYLLIVLLILPSIAMADFRCRGTIIQTGFSSAAVLDKCGKPTLIKPYARQYIYLSQVITVEGETWIYDLGSSKFKQELNIENDTVISIIQGSYGGKK